MPTGRGEGGARNRVMTQERGGKGEGLRNKCSPSLVDFIAQHQGTKVFNFETLYKN